MNERPCERWAIGTRLPRRLLDLLLTGHARHVCARDRTGFMLNHAGPHACRCGREWPIEPREVVRADDPNAVPVSEGSGS